MKIPSIQFIVLFAIASFVPSWAQEKLEMEGTAIIGNRELPKVLYIVPWKSVERFEITTPPVISIMDQKLKTIDRAAFKRKIHYHDAIFSKAKPTLKID